MPNSQIGRVKALFFILLSLLLCQQCIQTGTLYSWTTTKNSEANISQNAQYKFLVYQVQQRQSTLLKLIDKLPYTFQTPQSNKNCNYEKDCIRQTQPTAQCSVYQPEKILKTSASYIFFDHKGPSSNGTIEFAQKTQIFLANGNIVELSFPQEPGSNTLYLEFEKQAYKIHEIEYSRQPQCNKITRITSQFCQQNECYLLTPKQIIHIKISNKEQVFKLQTVEGSVYLADQNGNIDQQEVSQKIQMKLKNIVDGIETTLNYTLKLQKILTQKMPLQLQSKAQVFSSSTLMDKSIKNNIRSQGYSQDLPSLSVGQKSTQPTKHTVVTVTATNTHNFSLVKLIELETSSKTKSSQFLVFQKYESKTFEFDLNLNGIDQKLPKLMVYSLSGQLENQLAVTDDIKEQEISSNTVMMQDKLKKVSLGEVQTDTMLFMSIGFGIGAFVLLGAGNWIFFRCFNGKQRIKDCFSRKTQDIVESIVESKKSSNDDIEEKISKNKKNKEQANIKQVLIVPANTNPTETDNNEIRQSNRHLQALQLEDGQYLDEKPKDMLATASTCTGQSRFESGKKLRRNRKGQFSDGSGSDSEQEQCERVQIPPQFMPKEFSYYFQQGKMKIRGYDDKNADEDQSAETPVIENDQSNQTMNTPKRKRWNSFQHAMNI